ncbi:hypothetical protein ILUMI_02437 [Ignelater luminosus]|uniref:Large ribosomal subunit protein mL62 n=1 Tax=Ignelater luminosus TaxID=2038154 RepID=A0A8K0DDE7_IGNLU|nr:hypothetical protein ILUMI_02437 [Ignelater luminosus]
MNVCGRSFCRGIQNYYNLTHQHRFLAYKSSIALEHLYPGSNLRISTPHKPASTSEKFSGYVPIDQIQLTYSKSTGPGGQNVNKVNTKVDLRFHLESANWLSENTKKKLATNLKTRITSEGFLVFRSDVTRSQQLNVADCLEKLRSAIREAEYEAPPPSLETAEKMRRRYEKATAERLLIKRERSQIKQNRSDPSIHDIL